MISINQASYSADAIVDDCCCCNNNNSSNRIVTFCPLGVAKLYNCSACFPLGNVRSKRAPAVGWLMAANLLSSFLVSHFQTLGGTYDDEEEALSWFSEVLVILVVCVVEKRLVWVVVVAKEEEEEVARANRVEVVVAK